MKKFSLVLAAMFITGIAFATNVDNRVSGNVVSFSTISWADNRGPSIVTFNSATNYIRLTNLSTVADCYVDLRCVDANGKRGYCEKNTAIVFLPVVGKATPNTVDFIFSTHNLGFVGNTVDTTTDGGVSGSNQTVQYTVTGDGDL